LCGNGNEETSVLRAERSEMEAGRMEADSRFDPELQGRPIEVGTPQQAK